MVADVPVVRASCSSVMYSSRSEMRVDEDSDGGTTAIDKLSSFAGLTLTLSPATIANYQPHPDLGIIRQVKIKCYNKLKCKLKQL